MDVKKMEIRRLRENIQTLENRIEELRLESIPNVTVIREYQADVKVLLSKIADLQDYDCYAPV